MGKAWFTCFMLCGVCLQVIASENNNHADIKTLLKPSAYSLPNSAVAVASHDLENAQDHDNFVVFTPLTKVQETKYSTQICEIIKGLDEKTAVELKKQLALTSDFVESDKIIPALQLLAKVPNGEAINLLGDMYKLGQGVPQDRKQAFDYYVQAAKLKHSQAMNNLGECFTYGIGCQTNLETAAQWFRKAAELGNIEAQFNMGYVYEFGEGVPLDMEKARYWYEKAAAKQHPESYLFLGQMYLDGQGVPLNEALAKDYFGRACDLGSMDGCNLYQVMLSEN